MSEDLQRFVDAQARDYERALAELRAGRKRTDWMWYVFPQLALGVSENSKRFAIRDLEEARAYVAHPVLGRRLVECARALTALNTRTPDEVMGKRIDVLKLRSSMTLFSRAAPDEPVFGEVLDKYFDSVPDKETVALLDD